MYDEHMFVCLLVFSVAIFLPTLCANVRKSLYTLKLNDE